MISWTGFSLGRFLLAGCQGKNSHCFLRLQNCVCAACLLQLPVTFLLTHVLKNLLNESLVTRSPQNTSLKIMCQRIRCLAIEHFLVKYHEYNVKIANILAKMYFFFKGMVTPAFHTFLAWSADLYLCSRGTVCNDMTCVLAIFLTKVEHILLVKMQVTCLRFDDWHTNGLFVRKKCK